MTSRKRLHGKREHQCRDSPICCHDSKRHSQSRQDENTFPLNRRAHRYWQRTCHRSLCSASPEHDYNDNVCSRLELRGVTRTQDVFYLESTLGSIYLETISRSSIIKNVRLIMRVRTMTQTCDADYSSILVWGRLLIDFEILDYSNKESEITGLMK
jgi:hypothetical protein